MVYGYSSPASRNEHLPTKAMVPPVTFMDGSVNVSSSTLIVCFSMGSCVLLRIQASSSARQILNSCVQAYKLGASAMHSTWIRAGANPMLFHTSPEFYYHTCSIFLYDAGLRSLSVLGPMGYHQRTEKQGISGNRSPGLHGENSSRIYPCSLVFMLRQQNFPCPGLLPGWPNKCTYRERI